MEVQAPVEWFTGPAEKADARSCEVEQRCTDLYMAAVITAPVITEAGVEVRMPEGVATGSFPRWQLRVVREAVVLCIEAEVGTVDGA